MPLTALFGADGVSLRLKVIGAVLANGGARLVSNVRREVFCRLCL